MFQFKNHLSPQKVYVNHNGTTTHGKAMFDEDGTALVFFSDAYGGLTHRWCNAVPDTEGKYVGNLPEVESLQVSLTNDWGI